MLLNIKDQMPHYQVKKYKYQYTHKYFKNAFSSSDFYLIKQTMESCLRDVTEWVGSQDIGGGI